MMQLKRNHIYHGNALDVLKRFPAKSVSCCGTSPPYWVLRDNKISNTIWGGDTGCVHVWETVDVLRKPTPGDMPGPNAGINGNRTNAENRPGKPSGICSRCGAWRGQLGLEPNPFLFVKNLCDIFDQVKRVLRDDGTLWVILGDTYSGSGGAGGDWMKGKRALEPKWKQPRLDLPGGTLVLVPELFVTEMVYNRGWRARQVNIWAKNDPMPHPVRNRFTSSHESVFFFAKHVPTQYWVNETIAMLTSKKPLGLRGTQGTDWDYLECGWCNGTGWKQPVKTRCPDCKDGFRGFTLDMDICPRCKGKGHVVEIDISDEGKCDKCKGTGSKRRTLWAARDYWFAQKFEPLKCPNAKGQPFGGNKRAGGDNPTYSGREYDATLLPGRNMRDVWFLGTSAFTGAHFSTFPEELIEIPIQCGTPREICTWCGMPREPVIHVEGRLGRSWHDHANDKEQGAGQSDGSRGPNYKNFARFHAGFTDCGCNVGYEPGVFLDPFAGVGTGLLVAAKNSRDYVGIEMNPEYIAMAKKRLAPFTNNERLEDVLKPRAQQRNKNMQLEMVVQS